MKRIIIICEGQTEQEFCLKVIAPYLSKKDIIIQAPLIKKTMGGIIKWDVLKKEIETYLIKEKDVTVTTLIDFYGIDAKHDFPRWTEGEKITDKNERLIFFEDAMKADISDDFSIRFIPYIQLHEFEGLLFNDIQIFYDNIPEKELVGKEELIQTFNDFDNPEMINNNKDTSPGHRLERIIKGYNKIVYGNCIAEAIGIEKIKEKSPRFNQWIEKIGQI